MQQDCAAYVQKGTVVNSDAVVRNPFAANMNPFSG